MVVLVVLVGLAAAVGACVRSVGASSSSPATPSITSGPSGTVKTTSATFKYSDSTHGVSYLCALDSGSFKPCSTSGVNFAHLHDGTHVFRVAAHKNRSTSAPATRMWTVDTTGPSVGISFPRNLHTYSTATWNAGCAGGPGVCGTATDATGVAAVKVGVLSLTNLRYWNGSSFSSHGQFLLTATGTTHWQLPMQVPPTGIYAVLVSATDTLGNVRGVAQILIFRVTGTTTPTAPPAPSITSTPAAITTEPGASFAFSDTQAGVTFTCSLDGATATPCTSTVSYSNLDVTNHCFTVVAVNGTGQSSSPTQYCWTINGVAFSITGSTDTTFSPGATQTLNVSISNPNDFAIKVTDVTVTIDDATTKGSLPNPACVGTQNLVVAQPFTGSVTVGPNATVVVPAAQAPQLEMLNLLTTNQDACKGTTFQFGFTGTAILP